MSYVFWVSTFASGPSDKLVWSFNQFFTIFVWFVFIVEFLSGIILHHPVTHRGPKRASVLSLQWLLLCCDKDSQLGQQWSREQIKMNGVKSIIKSISNWSLVFFWILVLFQDWGQAGDNIMANSQPSEVEQPTMTSLRNITGHSRGTNNAWKLRTHLQLAAQP